LREEGRGKWKEGREWFGSWKLEVGERWVVDGENRR